ncbi:MAG: FAD binding domain-containing protein [Candidatus Hodarchaeales archaeon]
MEHIKEYIYPSTIEDALALIAEDNTIVIAGGTYLATTHHQSVYRLVDITRLPLNYIKKDENFVIVGATTTITEMLESSEVQLIGKGLLTKACRLIGDTPLRNQITMGGNIARKLPWVGLPVVLLVTEAEIVISSKNGDSVVSSEEFFCDYKLRNDQLIKEVKFPMLKEWFCRYEKFALSTVDYTWLTLALAALVKDGIIKEIHIASSRATKMKRFDAIEKVVKGQKVTAIDFSKIETTINDSVRIVSDFRSSKEYRKHLLFVLIRRMLQELQEEYK